MSTITADSGLNVSPEVEASAAKKAADKKSTKTTAPTKQKEQAKKAASPPASKEVEAAKKAADKKKAAERAARDAKWLGYGKGDRVRTEDGRTGTVSYRHTHEVDGKPVGMLGVLMDADKKAPAQVGGRKVKHISFAATDLTRII